MRKEKTFTKKSNSIFIRTFLLMMLLSILIIAAFCSMAYSFMYTNVKDKMKESNEYVIERIVANIDYSFNNVEHTFNIITKDDNVINAAMIPGIMSEDKHERNMSILNLLKDTSDNSRYIENMYIYETKENGLFTSFGSMYKMDTYFGKEELKKAMESDNIISSDENGFGYTKLATVNGKTYMVKEFLYSIDEPLSVLIAEIDEENLFGVAASLGEYKSLPVIVNTENEFVLKNRTIDGADLKKIGNKTEKYSSGIFWIRDCLVYKSDYSNWTYIIPDMNNIIDLSVGQLILPILPLAIVFLIISFVVSLLVSKSIYKPINKIVDIARENEEEGIEVKNEMDFLEAAIIKSKEKATQMQNVIENISQEVTDNYLKKIIFETDTSAEETVRKFSELKSPFSAKGKYGVIVAEAEESAKGKGVEKQCFAAVEKVLNKYMNESDETFSVLLEKEQVIAILRISDSIDEMDAALKIKNIKESIKKHQKPYSDSVMFFNGEIYGYLGGIRYSYKDCIEEMERSKTKNDNKKNYFRTLEEYFVQEFNNGNTREAKKLIEKIRIEFSKADISERDADENVKDVIVSVLDVANSNNMGAFAEEIREVSKIFSEDKNKKEAMEQICEIANRMADAADANRKKPYYTYLTEAKRYVEENYSDSNLSLGVVAEQIGINKAYLSSLFNENLKIGFLDYLNGHRIEKAKEMLLETDIPAKDIAEAVGFSTVQTFIRVFKKVEGVSPGAFRKSDI